MANRKSVRKSESLTDDRIRDVLRARPLLQSVVMQRLGLSSAYVATRLKKVAGVVCRRIKQKNEWSLTE